MKNFKLDINGRVDVLWDKEIYKSVIQDYKESSIYISIPVSAGVYLTLEREQEIDVIYYDEIGNVYSMTIRVEDKVKEGMLPLYKLSAPYNIKKIQRRNFVRVDISKVIKYKAESFEDKKFYSALLLDLSGGGMRIKIKEKLSQNDSVIGILEYDGNKIEIQGDIIRIQKAPDGEFICGVDFRNLSESIRERIIRTVFTIMRKQRGLQ